ncbi:MAG: hypothetical protein ACI3XA_04665 [Clostridia bacterium]
MKLILFFILTLILIAEVISDVLLLKIVSAKARAEPQKSDTLPIVKKARVDMNNKTWHDEWEAEKK